MTSSPVVLFHAGRPLDIIRVVCSMMHLIGAIMLLLNTFSKTILAERTPRSIKAQLDLFDVVPDVINTYPESECEVIYSCMNCPEDGRVVDFGTEIHPIETQVEPSVEWPADPNLNYALVLVDPDVPSKAVPTMREWQHWLVVNIPGIDFMSGKVLTEYQGATPPNGTGPHRYVFSVYQQPRKNMTFVEPKIEKRSDKNRSMFSTRRFADEYKLGDPIAVNFFMSEYNYPPRKPGE
ncbi:unnamed protein product [Bemisia tabaci]|uniref:Phosphatidylethanolamine-binding protein n=2 Tax=Bemisia tabaci TaxID=7038 RepID=A0A9P0FZL8_BEMTA|nr:unnamed protein product [Bemisia tabaci]